MKYPVIHKDITSNITSIISDYPNLVFTDGLRSNNNSENPKGSADDTLHKYGHAVDVRLNSAEGGKEGRVFLQQLQNNPALMKRYGIIRALAHGVGDNYHIHIEFKPNKL